MVEQDSFSRARDSDKRFRNLEQRELELLRRKVLVYERALRGIADPNTTVVDYVSHALDALEFASKQ